MTISVSVIIPTYNYGHLINRAVQSVLNQSVMPTEIIIVDDGSTDNTAEVIAQLQQSAQGHLIKYLQQPNSGPGAARNKGIQQAQTDWLIFLDADDELLPNAIQLWNEAIRKWPHKKVFFADYYSIEEHKSPKYVATPAFTANRAYNFYQTLFTKLYSVASSGRLLIQRALTQQLHYAEHVRHGEDIPFVALLIANYDCQAIGQATVNIYRHANSLRHQYASAQQDMLKIVDTIFNSSALPIEMKAYKQAYLGRRYTSLARIYLKQGLKKQTQMALFFAFKYYPTNLLKLSFWKKCVKSCFIQEKTL